MADNTEEKDGITDSTDKAENAEQSVEETTDVQAPTEDKVEETKEESTEETKEEATESPAEEAKEEVAEDPTTPEASQGEEVTVEVAEEVDVRPGYTVKLHLRINDGKKERIQIFEGIVLKVSGATPETRTITVRKVSKGFGVEKIVPLSMPTLEKVEVVKTAKVRRATLNYLRTYKKRLREKMVRK